MQQKRLLLALLLSAVILFGWSYLATKLGWVNPPSKTTQQSATPTPTPAAAQGAPASTPNSQSAKKQPSQTNPADANLRREIRISTPLYEAKFDTTGAVATSWIITKNKQNQHQLYSAGSTKSKPVPLELISQEGLKHQPREAPFQLDTADPGIDSITRNRNYSVEGISNSTDPLDLNLASGEQRTITFSLSDTTLGIELRKSITFKADDYSVDLQVTLTKFGHPVPQTKLQVGPSIGDQGISKFTFYSVAPEGIAFVGGRLERHQAHSINETRNSPDHLVLPGAVDWAAVGDTYFAMVAAPAQKLEGLEYFTAEYDWNAGGKPEKRYLIRTLVPIATDGSRNVVYVGPKDHYVLLGAGQTVGAEVGRPLDLGALVDYGWLSWLSRPIAPRILWAITKLHDLTSSYGVAIILFTIIIYSAFFPLKWRSSKAMKKAQKLAPRMKELQEKIKGMKQSDPRLKDLQMEQLRLMKEGNPLGGCLPLLIQMPFLFALYRAITISLDFRQASFLWLPDLSGGDPHHILEFLMAGTMIVLQLITPAPSADPVQRRMMAIGMPIFMLYILWGAPSGLLVYWLVGNIVGFTQQFLINRWTADPDSEQSTPSTPAGRKVRKT